MFNEIKYFDDDKCDFKTFLSLNKLLDDKTLTEQKRFYKNYIKIVEKKEEIRNYVI